LQHTKLGKQSKPLQPLFDDSLARLPSNLICSVHIKVVIREHSVVLQTTLHSLLKCSSPLPTPTLSSSPFSLVPLIPFTLFPSPCRFPQLNQIALVLAPLISNHKTILGSRENTTDTALKRDRQTLGQGLLRGLRYYVDREDSRECTKARVRVMVSCGKSDR
jgi:hypothetical protein